jgi:hypothetical protein
VAEQRKIICAETKNPFQKCIFTFDVKRDIEEKTVDRLDREERNRIRQRPNAVPRSGTKGFSFQGQIPEPLEE